MKLILENEINYVGKWNQDFEENSETQSNQC